MCGPPVASRVGSAREIPSKGAGLFLDPSLEPVASVRPGETIEVHTLDCAAGLISTPDDVIPHIDDLIERLGGLNYVTGPIAVEGARAGDVLRVTIEDIEPAPTTGRGFIAVTRGFGIFDGNGTVAPRPLEPATTICDVSRDEVVIPLASGRVTLPCLPFVGTIGVAPKRERRMSLSQSPEYGGDIDLPPFTVGSTLHLRANHEGGLLSLGDVHAAQGDGEFGGIAVEVDARVRLRVDVTPVDESSMSPLPLLVDAERVGVVSAFQGTPTTECVRAGAVALAELLVRWGMRGEDAIQYLSAAARVRLGNMFEPFYSAWVYLERATIPAELPADLR